MTAFSILWDPAGTSERAARANLAIPLLLLGAANALPAYALFVRYGISQTVQTRLNATPDGLFPTGVFFFTALTWLSPFVLPVMTLIAAFLLDYYVGFVLDTKVSRNELRRLVAWGALPLAIYGVIAGIIVIACGKQCNENNPLATNLAFFFESQGDGRLLVRTRTRCRCVHVLGNFHHRLVHRRTLPAFRRSGDLRCRRGVPLCGVRSRVDAGLIAIV